MLLDIQINSKINMLTFGEADKLLLHWALARGWYYWVRPGHTWPSTRKPMAYVTGISQLFVYKSSSWQTKMENFM